MNIEDTGMEVKEAKSLFSKVRGLMFRKKSNFNYCLLFRFRDETKLLSAIHSFFVFFKFDAVFLNSNKKVVDVREEIKPFTFSITPSKPSKYLLELPAGKTSELNIEVGDRIDFD